MRNKRVVKVGCTLQLAARVAQLRAQERGLKLAAWLWGDENMESFVTDRFATIRGNEWLRPCAELDSLIDGIQARQENDVEAMIYLYETLALMPAGRGRLYMGVSSSVFGYMEFEKKQALEQIERTKASVAKWVKKIRAHHAGERAP